MLLCILMAIAGSEESLRSAVADTLYQAVQHKRVMLLKMDSYLKSECLDHSDLQSYDTDRLHADIQDILDKNQHKVLIVDGALALYDDFIDEWCDVRVYADSDFDHDNNKSATEHQSDYNVTSRERADVILAYNQDVERSVWQLHKILRGWFI